MKIIAVCEKCHHHDPDPNIEINFYTKEIFWPCPECEKDNKIQFFKKAEPLPKTRLGGSRRR